jgi:lipoyl synthase
LTRNRQLYKPTQDLLQILDTARSLSIEKHGSAIKLYIPGMFIQNGRQGRYGAVSITGTSCALSCDHCGGTLLKSMPGVLSASSLLEYALNAWRNSELGILLSGGCDEHGKLPWNRFLNAIYQIKQKTGLKISIHSGLMSSKDASEIKAAGVDQVLIDVILDNSTLNEVCHLNKTSDDVIRTLENLIATGLDVVPAHYLRFTLWEEIQGN